MKEFDSRVEEFDSRVEEFDSRVEEFESSGGISGRGVKEYSRRVDEFVLLGHRTYATLMSGTFRISTRRPYTGSHSLVPSAHSNYLIFMFYGREH